MAYDVMVNGKDTSTMPVRTFDNGTATINTEICASLGYDFNELSELFSDYCTKVQGIETAESFD